LALLWLRQRCSVSPPSRLCGLEAGLPRALLAPLPGRQRVRQRALPAHPEGLRAEEGRAGPLQAPRSEPVSRQAPPLELLRARRVPEAAEAAAAGHRLLLLLLLQAPAL
jgi:hypothetical protein